MGEILKKTSAKPTWSALKWKIKTWETPKLLGLVKDLFELSANNRDFLAARLLVGDTEEGGQSVSVSAPYRQRIHDAFYDKGGWPRSNLRLAEARNAIREFRKATSDDVGTLNLMIAYVETGTEYSLEFGAEEESLFDSLSTVLNEIETVFSKNSELELYQGFQQRLLDLDEKAREIGWGFGDHMGDIIEGLEDRWSGEKEGQR